MSDVRFLPHDITYNGDYVIVQVMANASQQSFHFSIKDWILIDRIIPLEGDNLPILELNESTL